MTLPPLEWTCHICGRVRPDDRISVMKHHRMIRGVEFTENVRYCNDRPLCESGARVYHFIKE